MVDYSSHPKRHQKTSCFPYAEEEDKIEEKKRREKFHVPWTGEGRPRNRDPHFSGRYVALY
jgi:hypothetical protein